MYISESLGSTVTCRGIGLGFSKEKKRLQANIYCVTSSNSSIYSHSKHSSPSRYESFLSILQTKMSSSVPTTISKQVYW